jgi:hypothetical protein
MRQFLEGEYCRSSFIAIPRYLTFVQPIIQQIGLDFGMCKIPGKRTTANECVFALHISYCTIPAQSTR